MSLVIVANRLPVAVAGPPERPALRPADGGLVAALRGLHGAGDTRWVGWLGDPGGATATALADELAARDLHPVALTPSEVARYYDGFANGVPVAKPSLPDRSTAPRHPARLGGLPGGQPALRRRRDRRRATGRSDLDP
jgi:hypothetical protein